MTNPLIQVQNLHKQYGKTVAVRGISFDVGTGEIFGLIGPDGAGKTSTFHILAGVMEATAGRVTIAGKSAREARSQTGYLTQQFSLYPDLSIDENLRYSAGMRRVSPEAFARRREKYLRLMDLAEVPDRLAGQLSGGMKQKLALCTALIAEPQVLFLDEPTTGVDPVSRREFWDILASLTQEGVTVVVATPYLDEAERCHRVALMYEGQIQQIGTLAELRESLGVRRLEVRTPQLAAAEAALQEAVDSNGRQLTDIQSFGDRLDVLVKDAERGEARVRQTFEQQQLSLEDIQTVEPTLENVFVARLRQRGAEPPDMPFPRLRPRFGKAQRPPRHRGNGHAPSQEEIAIGAKGLRKVFGDFVAVKGVDLEVRYGEIFGLLGANGAGKTTTIKMLCGLLAHTSGDIVLAGETGRLRSPQVRRRIGYMSQKFTLYDDLTILQNLQFYCGVYGVPRRARREKIDWVLASSGLERQGDLLTGRLPGGWKQRVAFGASVMHEPEILFLDEPTSGVDPLARRQFWRLIEEFAQGGTAVVVTTHYLEEAEHCNRMGFMVAGEIVAQGSPGEIKAQQPGELHALRVDKPQRASNLLKTHFAPWRVSLFGEQLHVVLENPDTELPQMRELLAQEDVAIRSVRSIPFSLEDAFIGIVQRARGRSLHLQ
jgi:ABC-2 type transport system ATP-binding protein